MRIFLIVVGILLLLLGGVWFFQGINIFPGSFMTGQSVWAVIGAVTAVVGAGIMVTAIILISQQKKRSQ